MHVWLSVEVSYTYMQTDCPDGCVAWQGAAERLQRGAELLEKRLDQDDKYYAASAELQKRWKLKVLAAVSLPHSPTQIHQPGNRFDFSWRTVLYMCSAPNPARSQHAGRHQIAGILCVRRGHAVLCYGDISQLFRVLGRQLWPFHHAQALHIQITHVRWSCRPVHWGMQHRCMWI